MTGSGTQTDPYIVDSWAEFESIGINSNSSVYVHFNPDAENKIIDMNDIYPEGCPSYSIGSSKIYGNGWEIQNLYLKNPLFYAATYGVISGFKFTSFRHETSSPFLSAEYSYNNAYGCLFEKNSFTGITRSNVFLGISGSSTIEVYNNSFNLMISDDVTFRLANGITDEYGNYKKDIAFNNIKIQLTGNSKINSNGLFGACNHHNFVNNRINVIANTGCDFPIVQEANGFSGNVILGSNSGTIKPLYSGTCTGVNIYNSDTLNYTGTDSRFKGCTTEQMRNAEYLQSIGFAIGVD